MGLVPNQIANRIGNTRSRYIYQREWLSLLHSTFRSPDCHQPLRISKTSEGLQSPSEPLDQSARCCSTGSMPLRHLLHLECGRFFCTFVNGSTLWLLPSEFY